MGQFSCQNCTAGQGMDTDRDESRRRGGGGLPDARTLSASGVRQMPVWVLCLDSELLGSSFPVLPHPCQTLHSTVKQSRADSYPPELAFLQLVFANHSSEGERPPRPAFLCFNAFKSRNLLVYIDLCGGRPTETHQGSSRVGCWLDSSLRCTVSKYQY